MVTINLKVSNHGNHQPESQHVQRYQQKRFGWHDERSRMSAYFESLDWQGKKRYQEKLEAVGLSLDGGDPYSSDKRFSSDMTLWPKIEYSHIFAYFITRPGTFTQQELVPWKQMEAYNYMYFESEHVRTVLCMAFGTGKARNVLLKAKVNPSQHSPDNTHEAWLVAKLEGDILCAHCTCMAG